MSDQTNQTRRDLLRAAASAFTLAASGLFLPETGEDAAAKSGALGGKHGGRHGPNRRGRNKAKRRRRRKDRRQARGRENPPKGSGTILDVLVYVHNRRATSVTLRGWRMIDSEVIAWTPATDTITLPAKPASGPEPFHDFVFDVTHFAVAIGTSHIVEVGNRWLGYPWAVVGTGGWSQKGWDPKGQTLLDQGFLEGETATAPGFIVQRLNDSATHKRFLVNLV